MTDDATGAALAEPAVMEGPLADRAAWRPDRCPAAAALDVIGSRSALLVMREAMYGTTRFDDFVERVGVTEGVAAQRLRELTDDGLLLRVPYRETGQRTRYEYRITEKGADLAPVVLALFEWGAKYLSPAGRAPLQFRHRDCTAPVHVDIVCDDGHRVALEDVGVRPAPRRRR